MSDNVTNWLNFAQQSRDVGGLGLAPHQAAGLVGNLVNESGQALSPWGPTGDNGTAYGTAQWRGDRLSNLQQFAAQNGLDPKSIEGQQAFMRHEFDTTENKAYRALQGAQSPEDAASTVNHLYERSADTSGNREKSARTLMQQFGVGGAGPALSFADEEAEGNDDNPALSPDNTIGRGTLSKVFSGKDDAKNFLGLPKGRISQGLMGIAAAAASASDPQQSYALNSQLAQMQKAQQDDQTKYTVKVDPKTGLVYRIGDDGSVEARPTQATAATPPPGDVTKTGDDYLATLPTTQADYVRKMVAGEIAPPNARGGKVTPELMQLMSAASHYDPNFNLSTWQTRNAGNKDWFGGGQSQRTQKSLNQLFHHTADLTDSADALHNTSMPLYNEGKNWVNNKLKGDDSFNNWMQNAHAVADEVSSLYKGAGKNSDHEIKAWVDTLNPNMSPVQQHGAIAKMRQLVQGAIDANTEMRKAAIGPYAAAKAGSLIDPEAQKSVDKLDSWLAAGPKSPIAPGAYPKGVNSITVIKP